MKKFAVALLLLLNVTNTAVYADCVTGYACSIKDLNKNNTNSVIKENTEQNNYTKEKEKLENAGKDKIDKVREKSQENEIKMPEKSQI